MASADVAFPQAGVNNDQRLNNNEFRNFASAGGVGSGASDASYGAFNYGATTNLTGLGAAAEYGSSSYESTSISGGGLSGDVAYGGTGGGLSGDVAYAGAGGSSAGYGASANESSLYSSFVGGDYAAGSSIGVGGTDLSAANYSTTTQTAGVQQYETDAQGFFKDSNPQIVRRPAPGGGITYTQNIRVRFLQPPPVPPPGPLIIREVRPPQPPVPAPLRVRQQAPPLPQPPPLVLRERPPVPPATVASQTVIRRLAAIPVPPRSVIIERIPPTPPRPRDIIIERWVPYGPQAKRRTIVQRAAAVQQYARPRNIIIQYEAPQVRIVRQFQRLGVTQENPAAYVQRYGASLLEAQTLVQQARIAGVVEDISPPAVTGSLSAASSQFTSSGSFGYDAVGATEGSVGFGSGVADLGGTSSYESSYSAGTGVSGLGTGFGGGNSSYESSYSAGTGASGLGAGFGGGNSSYESSYSAGTGASGLGTGFGGVSSTDAAFTGAGY